MKSIFGDLAGGVVIMVVASLIGLAQNASRSKPMQLIRNDVPVAAASDAAADTAAADTAGTDTTSSAMPDGTISLEQMKRIFDNGNAFILDARAPDAFAKGHIPGAINIPYDKLPDYTEKLNEEVPPDLQVVCYCWGPECDFSHELARELRFMSYTNVSVFTGGWEAWTKAGYPTEEGSDE